MNARLTVILLCYMRTKAMMTKVVVLAVQMLPDAS